MINLRSAFSLRRILTLVTLVGLISIGLASLPTIGQASAAGKALTAPEPPSHQCRPKPSTKAPPPLVQPGGENPNPPCPPGQVPQPNDQHGPKGKHGPPGRQMSSLIPQAGTNFLYAAGYQFPSTAQIGAAGNFSQPAPFLSTSDFHSLAELAVESSDGRQIIEVGWTVDRSLSNNDTRPHLFIYHWVNGAQTCYSGCGYVQYSSTRYPGMVVSTTNTPQQYAMEFYQGNWWVWYQTEWIGYFPGSLWSNTFTQDQLTQWFGEVAASSTTPCTDMGNGISGATTGSAVINNMFFINGPFANVSTIATNPSIYNVGHVQGSSFTFGGPGAC